MRPAVAAPLLGSLLLGALIHSGPRPTDGRLGRPAPPPSAAEEIPWLIVDAAGLPALEGVLIGAVCFRGTPPAALVRAPLDLPPGHPLRRSGGIVLVHTLIDTRGRVVEAQILRGPDDEALRAAVVRCLAAWRFAPARNTHGEPWPVHFMLTLKVPPAAGGGAGGEGTGGRWRRMR